MFTGAGEGGTSSRAARLIATNLTGCSVCRVDIKDCSTNEPTMDGTASAILLLALAASGR